MIRKVVKIAVFLLVANFVYQIAPAAYHQFQFNDALEQLALFSQKSTDAELLDQVMTAAEENSIPLDRDDVQISRPIGSLIIDAGYIQSFTFFPGWHYPWEFDAHAKALDTRVVPPSRR